MIQNDDLITGGERMTREEAVNWLRYDIDMMKFDPTTGNDAALNDEARKVIEAEEMAIKALEQPECKGRLIRCKDCKWYGRADKRRFYRGMDCLQKRIDTIIPDKDFCSRAERREDGEKQ